jgi:hypothetical protein
MLSRLRERLAGGGPATVVAIIALSVALCGGAFAATASKTKKSGGVLITKLSQIAPSVRNQLKGAAGPQGSMGDAGAQGSKGDPGAKGDQGAKGNDGAPGKSVVVEESDCGVLGGVEVRLEGQAKGAGKEVCNGQDGSPWTAGGTLPAGATETGVWSTQASAAGAEFGIFVPVTFSIPLNDSTAPGGSVPGSNVHYGEESAEPFAQSCPGTTAKPKALPGHLCVYQSVVINTTFSKITKVAGGPESGAFSSGAIVEFGPDTSAGGSEPAVVSGTYAVTGCDATLPVGDPNKCP